MKIFALYSKVKLIQKPEWFDDFYRRYNTSTGYHVTLKQACFLEEKDLPDVKSKLSRLFDSNPIPKHEIQLIFNNLVLDTSSTVTKTIMLNAEPEPTIYHLQRSTLSALASYKEYVHPESQAWEETFKPHITIVSDVNSTDYQQAIKELGKNYTCRGIIRDVALIIVDNMVPREADNPENQIIYPL